MLLRAGVLQKSSWIWFCPEACSPQDLGKYAIFWTWETVWALAQKELLEQTVPPLGRSFVIGKMGEMEVSAPIKHGRKPPACL